MCKCLELVIWNSELMCKILPTTFQGFSHAWYNNFEPNFIKGCSNLYVKLVAHFNINILIKKRFTKLFGVAQQEGESTRVYWKRSNVEMLKVKELIESIALEALTRGVQQHVLWRKLYVLLDRARPK
jgi:hypothetical protein